MSTKTLRKRIALATVAALGAGVLSLVTTSVANAVANDGNNRAVGTAGTASAVGVLNIASKNSSIGSANGADSYSATDATTYTSVGLVNISDLSANSPAYAGTTQTAVLLSNGKLTVYSDTDGTYGATITVTGGTLTGLNSSAISNDGTQAAYALSQTNIAAIVSPNAGSKSMTVRYYKSTGAGSLTSPTAGTLAGQITVTVVSTSTSGVLSTVTSGIYYADSGASSNTDLTADTTSTNTTSHKYGGTIPWTQTGYATVSVLDAYGVAITSSGLLTVSATNGALVGIDDGSGTAAAGTQSTAYVSTSSPDAASIAVAAPSAAPLSTVVTVSWNGTVIGTKSWTFTGPIAKITVGAANRIALNGYTASHADGKKGATISFADAAGNVIYPVASDNFYPTAYLAAAPTSDRGTVKFGVVPTSTTTGYVSWSCGANASSDNLVAVYTNIDGTIATSNASKVNCAGTAATYTVAFDKSTYTPGALATLNVTLKDSYGNLAADDNAWAAGNTSTSVVASGGDLVTASGTSDTSSLGVVAYQVKTVVTEGTYQTTVKFPSVTGTTGPLVASFTLSSGSTSLNDVLKGIVDLIASINKQIAALAKLVTATKKK